MLEVLQIQNVIVEILLSVVLMFNVGAYSFLWYKIRRVEEDVEQIDNLVTKIEKSLGNLWNRIYGHDEDDTEDGFLVESEMRFDSIDRKLDKIQEQIDMRSRQRKQEHKDVREDLELLIGKLTDEDSIDVHGSEFNVEDS